MKTDMRRITGRLVPPLVPPGNGSIDTLLIGEAPGPRGADRSGVPFLGDRAGRLVYEALVRAERCTFPIAYADCRSWTGDEFARHAVWPVVRGVVLTNAYSRCPTDDRVRFRAPRAAELRAPANVRRLRQLMVTASGRGLTQVLTLGAVAARVIAPLMPDGVVLHVLRHPSAQGLLQGAPNQGKGMKLAILEEAWVRALVVLLR